MIKFYNKGNFAPKVSSAGAAGIDLFVNTLSADRLVIGTGVHVEIPVGYVGIVAPRSSSGMQGFKLANTIGVIDSDYRGEIQLVRELHATKGSMKILPGDKIAQMVVVPCITKLHEVNNLEDLVSTERGEGGFGSTGGA